MGVSKAIRRHKAKDSRSNSLMEWSSSAQELMRRGSVRLHARMRRAAWDGGAGEAVLGIAPIAG